MVHFLQCKGHIFQHIIWWQFTIVKLIAIRPFCQRIIVRLVCNLVLRNLDAPRPIIVFRCIRGQCHPGKYVKHHRQHQQPCAEFSHFFHTSFSFLFPAAARYAAAGWLCAAVWAYPNCCTMFLVPSCVSVYSGSSSFLRFFQSRPAIDNSAPPPPT